MICPTCGYDDQSDFHSCPSCLRPKSDLHGHACHWRLTPAAGNSEDLKAMLRGDLPAPEAMRCTPTACPWRDDCDVHLRWLVAEANRQGGPEAARMVARVFEVREPVAEPALF